jgi:hypothetical protein
LLYLKHLFNPIKNWENRLTSGNAPRKKQFARLWCE